MPTLNKNQQNLEEEMKKHPVLTFADIIKSPERTSGMVRRVEKNYSNHRANRTAEKN